MQDKRGKSERVFSEVAHRTCLHSAASLCDHAQRLSHAKRASRSNISVHRGSRHAPAYHRSATFQKKPTLFLCLVWRIAFAMSEAEASPSPGNAIPRIPQRRRAAQGSRKSSSAAGGCRVYICRYRPLQQGCCRRTRLVKSEVSDFQPVGARAGIPQRPTPAPLQRVDRFKKLHVAPQSLVRLCPSCSSHPPPCLASASDE